MMTTREIADYLRVKERKIYDLIRQEAIPCALVSEKWLFPKALIDCWVLQSVQGGKAGAVGDRGQSRRAAGLGHSRE